MRASLVVPAIFCFEGPVAPRMHVRDSGGMGINAPRVRKVSVFTLDRRTVRQIVPGAQPHCVRRPRRWIQLRLVAVASRTDWISVADCTIRVVEKAFIRNRFNISVIYLTAHGKKDIFQRAKKTRPFGYILKPLQDMQFSIAIEVAIELYMADKELQKSNRYLEETLAELRETQQEVVRRERLRVLGQMAQGIAHSLMSTMTGIVGLSHVLRDRLERINPDGKDDFLNLLASIIDSAGHATDVVRSLRAFYRSRKEDEVFHPVSLNKLIHRKKIGTWGNVTCFDIISFFTLSKSS